MRPTISIVVNTNGRAKSLAHTLNSFRWLDYPDFEVCVVCGPTEDGTREMVRDRAARGDLKYAECDLFNLSASRNIGIRMASGDIVAFIDDDAVPEPEWLSQLAPAFSDPSVGAVGGVTYDHTGYTFQAQFILCDRFGDAQLYPADPGAADHSFPYSRRYPSLMGTNSAFRRSAIVEIGGFDEEFEYYLDETDVCCRIVDAGHRIVELPNAAVHHKFLPSHLRNEHRFLKTPFPVLKNKVYFAASNSPAHHSIGEAIRNIQTFFAQRRGDIVWGLEHGRVSGDALAEFDEQADRAWRVGMARGLEGRPRTRPDDWFGPGEGFRQFPVLGLGAERRTFVFLSQNYPPESLAGNARHTSDIARAIASIGHNVHVLTRGRDFNRVDLEDGVWVHRIAPVSQAPYRLPDGQIAPQSVWDYSATMLDEVRRISRSRRVDAVEGVSWDCETAAFVVDGRFPVATNIVTSMAHWLPTQPERANDARWLEEFAKPMLALERLVYDGSDCNIAASDAIVASLREHYGAAFEPHAVARCPHGLEDMRPLASRRPASLGAQDTTKTKVLFVGRLELRKGIDILLSAVARLLETRDDLEFWIAGDNTLKTGGGRTEQQKFLDTLVGRRAGKRVRFLGPVTDAELRWLYAACDLFVAPSRFESFGLIYVEAMMFAKPVIGCRAGGVTEVVSDGETGVLVSPGDASQLADAIARLADDPALRQRMGVAGRAAYDRCFAAPVVARRRIAALAGISRRPFPSDRIVASGEIRSVGVHPDGEGLLLESEAALTYADVARSLHLTFLQHDWSGVVEIRVNGAAYAQHDLYSPTRSEKTVRIVAPSTGARVEVLRTGRKNPRSHAAEVIIIAAEER